MASRVTGPSSSCVPWCTRSLRLLPHFGLAPASPLLLFEKIYGGVAIVFANNRTLGIRNDHSFRGHGPTAHTLACLRQRPSRYRGPSQGSLPARAGSPLAGRVLHPLDDVRNFMKASQSLQSQSTSRAWSH